MSRLLITDATILTQDDERPFLEKGTVVVENGYIGEVSEHAVEVSADDTVIDGSRMVATPGLVNLHYHVDLGKAAGESNERKPMWDLLFDDWYPFLGQLTEEEAYWATLASYAESIRNGTTTVNDMYVLSPARARAAREIGMRAILSNEIATPETGIHIHLNESLSEVDDALRRFGKRPTELAYELGFLGPDVVAAHCVHLDDAEIGFMAETGTHISHNPGSNAYLGNGIARLNDFQRAGINVGIGTDAGFCSDLFEIMRWAAYLHRATTRDIYARSSAESLVMATRNGSRALGQKTGVLNAGMKADLILIDVDQVKFAMMDRTNGDEVTEFVVNQANGSDVDTSIIDGRVVMRGGVLTTVDENAISEGVARSLREAGERYFGGH
ncbi:amidohydrolase family protein [Microbacterium sp. SLBN-146]|uniref:amidohydrolase family protein n=1 Tax=Microbacterium sp. SLBN-146 TaxID=2768457 RepID=UPI00115167F8|nr:amidohydrolase family protein [Microbacterium sp. SLBN-146]TQJ29976.1 cytosine/adenosine deaminase-related metal-dependent hydrolase [Microbacterium sp. SLBN-146]